MKEGFRHKEFLWIFKYEKYDKGNKPIVHLYQVNEKNPGRE